MKEKDQRFRILQVNITDPAVEVLIHKLNAYQWALYGPEKCNHESPESLQKNGAYMTGAWSENELAAIGAVKIMEGYAEIKRMYVDQPFRGLGLAEKILDTLEQYVLRNGISRICLETGNLHTAALQFYRKKGYKEVVSFGSYQPNGYSIYFEKWLTVPS